MSRYIDADRLKKHFGISKESCTECAHNHGDCRFRDEYSLMDFCSAIDDLPAADVTEVRHGRWEFDKEYGQERCSECGHIPYERLTFCCNCGAKMDEKSEKKQDSICMATNLPCSGCQPVCGSRLEDDGK